VSERLRRARRGVRGGALGPPSGGRGQPPDIFGGRPPNIFSFWADIFSGYFRDHISGTTYFRDHMILGGFSAHGFLPMVFYFRLRN
jgi:hypothetical protein